MQKRTQQWILMDAKKKNVCNTLVVLLPNLTRGANASISDQGNY